MNVRHRGNLRGSTDAAVSAASTDRPVFYRQLTCRRGAANYGSGPGADVSRAAHFTLIRVHPIAKAQPRREIPPGRPACRPGLAVAAPTRDTCAS